MRRPIGAGERFKTARRLATGVPEHARVRLCAFRPRIGLQLDRHLQAFQIFQEALRVEVPLPTHLIIAALDKWVGR